VHLRRVSVEEANTYARERARSVEQPLRPSAMLRPAAASSLFRLHGDRRLVSSDSRAGKEAAGRAAICSPKKIKLFSERASRSTDSSNSHASTKDPAERD